MLEVATPRIFLTNAFSITGLRVDATAREVTKHADKLRIMGELGGENCTQKVATPTGNAPTPDQVRDAIQRLKDPERRIIDEFFWFWPKPVGQSMSDPALQAFEAGDFETALKIWTSLETSPSDGVVAVHNVAVFWLLRALERDAASLEGAEPESTTVRETEKLWHGAATRWELLQDDDLFWELVGVRVKQADDPRLTTGFVRRMRTTLPDALAGIHAELAVRYAERKRSDMARRHVLYIREAKGGREIIQTVAERVLAPIKGRLKQQIRRAQERVSKDPADALKAGLEMLDQARPVLDLFELFLGASSEERNELSDEVAIVCNGLPVEYYKSSRDEKGCLALLREALVFAILSDTRKLLQKSIGIIASNLRVRDLDPIYAMLNALQDNAVHPGVRLKKFHDVVALAIAKARSDQDDSTEFAKLADFAAGVLRGLSLEAWNERHDIATALAANEQALLLVRDGDLKKRLMEDLQTLGQLRRSGVTKPVPSAAAPSRWSAGGVLGGLAGAGLFVAFLVSYNSPSQTPSRSIPNPSPTQPTYVLASPSSPPQGSVTQRPSAAPQSNSSNLSAGSSYSAVPTPPTSEAVRRAIPGPSAKEIGSTTVPSTGPVQTILTDQLLQVANVPPNDKLKLRDRPTQTGRVVAEIAWNVQNLIQRGEAVRNGSDYWVPVEAGRYRGFVNSKFVEPVRQAPIDTSNETQLPPSEPAASSTVSSSTPPTFSQPAFESPKNPTTYSIPQAYWTQLERDRFAVEEEKTKARALASRLESLSVVLERERASLNRSSQPAVDIFNRRVNSYNAILNQVREQDQTVSRMVDAYNAKLEQYGRPEK